MHVEEGVNHTKFKDEYTIHLCKRKGNHQVCELLFTGKNLLNRLNVHHDQTRLLPKCQCGLTKDRGIIDIIFISRQHQEKSQRQNVDLYMTFRQL